MFENDKIKIQIKLFDYNKDNPIFQSLFFKNNNEEKKISSLINTCNKDQKTFNAKEKQFIFIKKLINTYANSQKVKNTKGKHLKF